jgi:hypothetical protein
MAAHKAAPSVPSKCLRHAHLLPIPCAAAPHHAATSINNTPPHTHTHTHMQTHVHTHMHVHMYTNTTNNHRAKPISAATEIVTR